MAIELSLYIHQTTISKLQFLRSNQSQSFLAWICPLIKTQFFDTRDYICFDGDEIQCIYFHKKGKCGFVLPRYSNIKYIDID